MTGANRLLIGLGWAAVVLVAAARGSRDGVRVHPRQRLELRFLLLATAYSFLIPLTRTLNLFDAAVLLVLFGAYVVGAARSEAAEVELVGPAAWLESRTGTFGRRGWAIFLLALSGYAIFISAEPFADGLVFVGRNHAVDEFLLVQWVAPLASESPEFIIAILFALRYRADVGLGALISAKVNQWTLLVGALPIAYALSAGSTDGLPLDPRQMEEVFLTSAQSLLAVVLIVELHFSLAEAVVLAALFFVQLIFPSTEVRLAFAVLYLALSAGLVVHSAERRAAFRALLHSSD